MSTKAYRNREVLVSTRVFEALKALAEVNGMDCPDAFADHFLTHKLSEEADLPWLIGKRKDVLDDLRKEYKERITKKQQPEDELP